MGCLTELLSEPSFAQEPELYHPFRCESSLITVRPPGWTVGEFSPGFNRPHVVRPVAHAQPMRYQVDGGKIFGGLTTVIIELNDVEPAKGGTVSCHDIAGIWVGFFQECQRCRCGQGDETTLDFAAKLAAHCARAGAAEQRRVGLCAVPRGFE